MKHTQIDGLWRITDDKDKILTDNGKPQDNGGHTHLSDSLYHVMAFGITESKKPLNIKDPTKKVKKA